MPEKNADMGFCKSCGKIRRSGRIGTMTSWIFGDNPCACADKSMRTSVIDYPNHPELSLVSSNPGALSTITNTAALSDRFEILELLGQGGMGCVYRIKEYETQNNFALKTIEKDSLMVQT